jgi:hypothetical protein
LRCARAGRTAFAVGLLVTGVLAGCGPERLGPPRTPAPVVTGPEDTIPADLDVVLRLDLQRIRQTLGNELIDGLKLRALRDVSSKDPDGERLITEALAQARVLVVGIRPGKDPELTDNVLALSGDFSELPVRRHARKAGFDAGTDLGGGFRVYSRPAPVARSAPARIYTRAHELVVFVSTAEIDSVERRVERRLSEAELAPPAKGVFSVALRPARIATRIADRSPAAARLLGRGKLLQGHLEFTAVGLVAELELQFELEEEARRAADAAGVVGRALMENRGVAGEVARALHVEAVGPALVVRCSLDSRGLARLAECARNGAGCS